MRPCANDVPPAAAVQHARAGLVSDLFFSGCGEACLCAGQGLSS